MKVIYATDGLPPALAAGRVLEKLGRREHLQISVLSVALVGIPAPEHLPLMLDSLETRREQATELASGAAENLAEAGFKDVSAITGEGNPEAELLREVQEGAYDLIVMGGGSSKWLGQMLLGSVSTRVLHGSPSSVLVVHETPDERDGVVILGVDGSSGSLVARDRLVEFADPARCRVEVISVAPHVPPVGVPQAGGFAAQPEDEDVTRQLDELAAAYATEAATTLNAQGFEAHGRAVRGHPSGRLLEEAKDLGADLVVVGSRGMGAIRRTLLGSVGEHIARHAPAALIARPD